jgi:predicted AlkP superfamily phosphohydrolase/phosphomutase
MSARVLVIGLDASERTLLDRWAGEGHLPALSRLREQAAEYRLDNTLRTLPAALWSEIWSGRSAGRSGFYLTIRQLRTGETAPRAVEADEVDPTAFWTIASDAGRRVAALDIPASLPAPGVNGLHVSAWGAHDRPFGVASEPPALLDDVRERYGDYPLWTDRYTYSRTNSPCYGLDGSHADHERMLDDLFAGLKAKLALFRDLLDREQWDLFACAFGEPQCVGHQYWGYLDDPAAPPRLRTAMRDVYQTIDAAVGELVAAAGDGASVLLLASHGMGPVTGGRQLIPEVLVRLGYGSGAGTAAQVRSRLPPPLRAVIRRLVPSGLRASLQVKAGSLASPLDSPTTRAVALDGDSASWIRLNLQGREPNGCVAPEDAGELLEEIRRELLALEDPRTGERIVVSAKTPAEAFGPDHHPDVPDLLVSFRHDLGRIDACRSERVGLVREQYVAPGRRTGEHPPGPSWLWATGPGFAAGSQHGGNVLDIAPTVLSLLGVDAPPSLDGQALPMTGR